MIAYHIDRLMAVQRVPATVARSVNEDEAKKALVDKQVLTQLKACSPENQVSFQKKKN